MSLKAYEENDIKNIANAIRNHNITGNFTVAEMASNIDNIQGGGTYGSLNVSVNGVYNNPSPYDAWNKVNVQVPTSIENDVLAIRRNIVDGISLTNAVIFGGWSGSYVKPEYSLCAGAWVNCLSSEDSQLLHNVMTTMPLNSSYMYGIIFSNLMINLDDVYRYGSALSSVSAKSVVGCDIYSGTLLPHSKGVYNSYLSGNLVVNYHSAVVSDYRNDFGIHNIVFNSNNSRLDIYIHASGSRMQYISGTLLDSISCRTGVIIGDVLFHLNSSTLETYNFSFGTVSNTMANYNITIDPLQSFNVISTSSGSHILRIGTSTYKGNIVFTNNVVSISSYGDHQRGSSFFEGAGNIKSISLPYGINVYSGSRMFNGVNLSFNVENFNIIPTKATTDSYISFYAMFNNVWGIDGNIIIPDAKQNSFGLFAVPQHFNSTYVRINNVNNVFQFVGTKLSAGNIKSIILENCNLTVSGSGMYATGYNNNSLFSFTDNLTFVYERKTTYQRWVIAPNAQTVQSNHTIIVTNEIDFNNSLFAGSQGFIYSSANLYANEISGITPFTQSVETLDDNGNLTYYNYNITRVAEMHTGSAQQIPFGNIMFGTREV